MRPDRTLTNRYVRLRTVFRKLDDLVSVPRLLSVGASRSCRSEDEGSTVCRECGLLSCRFELTAPKTLLSALRERADQENNQESRLLTTKPLSGMSDQRAPATTVNDAVCYRRRAQARGPSILTTTRSPVETCVNPQGTASSKLMSQKKWGSAALLIRLMTERRE